MSERLAVAAFDLHLLVLWAGWAGDRRVTSKSHLPEVLTGEAKAQCLRPSCPPTAQQREHLPLRSNVAGAKVPVKAPLRGGHYHTPH